MKYENDVKEITKAYERLKGECVKTNVRTLSWLKQFGDFDVVGKFENQQITGSFKYRGAYNYMSQQDIQRSVIAASAGNHALAVAEAGKKFGIQTTICIPTNTSSIKKNRLSAYPHSLLLEGASLEESGRYAIQLAKDKDWDYVSPYNNSKIIHGQGTVGLEFLEQVPDLDALIVPVGGGGLISGIALAAKKIKPSIKIIGVAPELYSTFYSLKKEGKLKKTANSPTFADGLAVNLEENSMTPDIIEKFVDDIVIVTEEEIAAGVLALLYHESQLVEGGGASGIAALISGKIDKNIGKIGVVLSGGNIATSSLSKILHYPFTNEALFDYINIYGEQVLKKIPLKGVDYSPAQKKLSIAKADNFGDQEKDVIEDVEYFKSRYNDLLEKVQKYRYRFEEYVDYCKIKKITVDEASVKTFSELDVMVEEELSVLKDYEKLKQNHDTVAYNNEYTKYLRKYRSVLHLIQAMSLILDWRSASYSQSVDTMFFNLNSQENPSVNYNRYESDRLVSVEKQMAEVLGVDQNEMSVLLTSSGMAAYTLLESYLIRYVLQPGDSVYLPHYIYFETDEQISQLSGVNVVKDDIYDVESIVKGILKEKPKVVLLDPITNTVELRMIDIYQIVEDLSKEKLPHDTYIAIDGSLMSGEIDLQTLFNTKNNKLHVIYYDSCSKYLQLGMDISMGGLIAFPYELSPVFERLRRNTGTILYDVSANIFPAYDRKIQKKRMRRFARNALLISDVIKSDKELSDIFEVRYPMLEEHADYLISRKFDSAGGLMTFVFKEPSLNARESLNSFIETVLHVTAENKVSLTKGVSFGFSLPRISAAAAMAENASPFLRLSVGDRSHDATVLLAQSIVSAVKMYLRSKEVK